jgi:hypothetical protein
MFDEPEFDVRPKAECLRTVFKRVSCNARVFGETYLELRFFGIENSDRLVKTKQQRQTYLFNLHRLTSQTVVTAIALKPSRLLSKAESL